MRNDVRHEILAEPVVFPEGPPLFTTPLFTQKDRAITYLHRHDKWEFGLCLDGSGIFAVGNQVHPFAADDVVCIPPKVPHLAQSSPHSVSRWKWTYLDFPGILLPAFPEMELDFLNRLTGTLYHGDVRLTSALRNLQNAGLRREDRVACTVLFASALRDCGKTGAAVRDSGSGFDRIGRALHYLSSHYGEDPEIGTLSGLCGMSPANFRRVFRREIGCSPQEYMTRLRITRAKALLKSGFGSIGEIAAESGYPSISCFNRKFKKMTGMTPREYSRKS